MPPLIPPYNFAKVGEDRVGRNRKAPVWHDVFPQLDKLSGRIKCTGYATTPLIVGNEQTGPEGGHKTIKPFKFPDGKYGIPGHTLKGMVANVYAALTDSPMERVSDRTFSFRPNLRPNRRTRFGLVLKILPNEIKVLWLEKDRIAFGLDVSNAVTTAPPEDETLWEQWIDGLPSSTVRCYTNGPVIREWYDGCGFGPTPYHNCVRFKCGGGLDGGGTYASAFAAARRRNPPRSKFSVLIWRDDLKSALRAGQLSSISDQVLGLYCDTQKHIVSDHISHGHPLTEHLDRNEIIGNVGRNRRPLEPGDAVFFEEEGGKVVSVGRSYFYRFRYANTITKAGGKQREVFDVSQEQGKKRDGLTLSPRRRLFGFCDHGVSSEDKAVNAYAGRVKFSYARYTDGGNAIDNTILKILGSPKPSAYEFYVDQDHNPDLPLKDWGDPGNPGREGRPCGRKFYLHNPKAARDARCFAMQPLDWPDGHPPDDLRHRLNQTAETLLAPDDTRRPNDRFPKFEFEVKFENLDAEELQYLRLSIGLGNDPEVISRSVASPEPLQAHPCYSGCLKAHKIGHGQPLGLGSFLVTIDKLELLTLEEGLPKFTQGTIHDEKDAALWNGHEDLANLLTVRNLSIDVGYPRKDRQIHGFHTQVRQMQALKRIGAAWVTMNGTALPRASETVDARRALDGDDGIQNEHRELLPRGREGRPENRGRGPGRGGRR